VAVDPEERGHDQRGRSSLLLAGFDGRSWFEQATADLTADGIARAAAALGRWGRARRGAAVARPGAARVEAPCPIPQAAAREVCLQGPLRGPRLEIDPRARPIGEWLERTGRLFDAAANVGGSRLVYRAASLEVDDSEVLFVGDGGQERAQRLVRTRARVLFLGWTGSALAADEAAGAGPHGLEGAMLATSALERAAEGALTLLTSGRIDAGTRELVLDPSVAALLVRHGAARGFEGDAWAQGGARAAALEGRAAGSEAITLRDEPGAASAYGGYRFDDEGWPAASRPLMERGVVGGPLCDAAAAAALRRPRTGHGRRGGPLDAVAPRPSHLVLAAGARERDELIASIDGHGFLIESGADGSGDPQSWRVAVRARRAREIERGRLTGRVYGPVVVAGDVPALLGAVRALDRSPEVHGWHEPGRSGSVAVSVEAPALLTRGWLAQT
jgi:predicted Zn-dependent protease